MHDPHGFAPPCPRVATALVAAVGDGSTFRRGRDLTAWLGLVRKPRLLGITRSGSKYLHMLFFHGAKAALPSLASAASPLGA